MKLRYFHASLPPSSFDLPSPVIPRLIEQLQRIAPVLTGKVTYPPCEDVPSPPPTSYIIIRIGPSFVRSSADIVRCYANGNRINM